MKTMMLLVVVLVAMCGCANTSTLQAKVATAEEANAKLRDRVQELEITADTCQKAVQKLHEVEATVGQGVSSAWDGARDYTSEALRSVETGISEQARATMQEAQQWMKDHGKEQVQKTATQVKQSASDLVDWAKADK
jgi:cellobiose-specific phosphotransferase system component IIA